MSIAIITTHAADALSRLLQEYKNSPKLISIIAGLAAEIQLIENAFGDLDLARSINTASGPILDRIGATVGVDRSPDLSDGIFRILILGKITANVSQGETESVIATYLLLTQASQVNLSELFPAAVSVYSNGSIAVDVMQYVGKYLRQAMPAGVSIEEFGLYDENAAFGFATDPAALGFSDDNNLAIGGFFATQVG